MQNGVPTYSGLLSTQRSPGKPQTCCGPTEPLAARRAVPPLRPSWSRSPRHLPARRLLPKHGHRPARSAQARGARQPHLLAVGRPAAAGGAGVAAAAGEDHRGRGARGKGGPRRSGNSLLPVRAGGGCGRGLARGSRPKSAARRARPATLEQLRGPPPCVPWTGVRARCRRQRTSSAAASPPPAASTTAPRARRPGAGKRPCTALCRAQPSRASRPPARSLARRPRPAPPASAPALGLPGWGGNRDCAAPPSRAMVGSGAPRAAHSWEQPPQALWRCFARASRPTW